MAVGPGGISDGHYLDGKRVYNGWTSSDFIHASSTVSLAWCKATPVVTYVVKGVTKTAYFKYWKFVGTAAPGWDEHIAYNISTGYSTSSGNVICYAYYETDSPGPSEEYKTVATASTKPTQTTESGAGTYLVGSTCTLTTSIKDGSEKDIKFVCWTSSYNEIVWDKQFTFTVTRDVAWMAVYENIKRTGLILYDRATDPDMILRSPTNNLILRDE